MAGLEDLYREIILDHYKNPPASRETPPPALRTEGFNPLCGDEVVVTVDLEDGVIRVTSATPARAARSASPPPR